MIVVLKSNHVIHQVYFIDKINDAYEIWIEGQETPIYEKIEDVVNIVA